MGLPARMLSEVAAPVRPGRTRAPATSGPRARAREEARCLRTFRLACVTIAALGCFGLGRVTLAVKAAEASIDAGRLQADIKAERLVGDVLETDRSALATPSRIEAVACTSMNMAEACDISYLALSGADGSTAVEAGDTLQRPEAVSETTSQGEGGIRGFVASLVEMAAGEAQVLLVGDAGLASTR